MENFQKRQNNKQYWQFKDLNQVKNLNQNKDPNRITSLNIRIEIRNCNRKYNKKSRLISNISSLWISFSTFQYFIIGIAITFSTFQIYTQSGITTAFNSKYFFQYYTTNQYFCDRVLFPVYLQHYIQHISTSARTRFYFQPTFNIT